MRMKQSRPMNCCRRGQIVACCMGTGSFPGKLDLGTGLVPGMWDLGTHFPEKWNLGASCRGIALMAFRSLKSYFLFRIRRRRLRVFSDGLFCAAAKWILTRICATFKAAGFTQIDILALKPTYSVKFPKTQVYMFF